jgi:glutamate-1-semialdehyde 2,1-aminomutase
VLFILDETTTGFRLAYGGAQEVFGLQPDLSTYGKAVGGGLPLGVVAGRADLMASFGGEPSARSIFTASTFSGHPLSVAASAAALGFAAAHRDTLYPALDRLAQHLADGVAGIADRLGITARMLRAGSIIRLAFGTPHKRGWAVPEDLRRLEDAVSVFALHGGLLMQSGLRGFVSGAHTESDINRVVEILDAAMIQAKSDGLFTALAQG